MSSGQGSGKELLGGELSHSEREVGVGWAVGVGGREDTMTGSGWSGHPPPGQPCLLQLLGLQAPEVTWLSLWPVPYTPSPLPSGLQPFSPACFSPQPSEAFPTFLPCMGL